MISLFLPAVILASGEAHASGFTWMQLLPGMHGDGNLGEQLGLTNPHEVVFIPTTWVVVLATLGLAALARMGLDRALARPGNEKFLPDSTLTLRNLFEIIISFLHDLTVSNLGKKETGVFFPLVGSLFVYVLISNLSGFIPGFLPPTDNFSSNFAMATCVFLTFVWAGLSRDAAGFVKHLMGPVWWLIWLIFPLEIISLFIRPMSLSIRLTVNIFVDHLLQQIARDVGGMMTLVGAALIPVPLYALGLLVCVIQAFIFSLLTVIYLAQSLPHGEHGDEGHAHH